MLAFRRAIDRDARHDASRQFDPDDILSSSGTARGNGVATRALKKDLSSDLSDLLSNVDLASAIDLDGLEYVEKSIINYGMPDISRLSVGSMSARNLVKQLRLALLRHEPRLVPDSLEVTGEEGDANPDQTVKYSVAGEMICQPRDVPYEFDAECDLADAKVAVSTRGSEQ